MTTLAAILKRALDDLGIGVSELSRMMGQSPQNFGKKLLNETLNFAEFSAAMDKLGIKYDYKLTYPGEEPPEMLTKRLTSAESDYLVQVGHDVRNSVNVITGCVDQAIKHKDDTQEYLLMIKRAASQLSSYIDAMQHLEPKEKEEEE